MGRRRSDAHKSELTPRTLHGRMSRHMPAAQQGLLQHSNCTFVEANSSCSRCENHEAAIVSGVTDSIVNWANEQEHKRSCHYLRKQQGASFLSHRLLRLSRSHEYLRFTIVNACWALLLYHATLYAPFVCDDLDQVRNNLNLGSLHSVVTRFVLAQATFANQFRG